MKTITEYINESLTTNLKNKLVSILTKLMNTKSLKQWKSNCNFLKQFVNKKETINTIDKCFDFDDKDSFIELPEYGAILDIPAEVRWINDTHDIEMSVKTLKTFIKDDNDWQIFKSDDNFAWFLPALQAWDLDINDMEKHENEIINVIKNFYGE